MPIDSLIFNTPATKGEVAGVAIATSIALHDVLEVLNRIKGVDGIDESLKNIHTSIGELDKKFDVLTGWTSDGS